jgi:hypothetical protein
MPKNERRIAVLGFLNRQLGQITRLTGHAKRFAAIGFNNVIGESRAIIEQPAGGGIDRQIRGAYGLAVENHRRLAMAVRQRQKIDTVGSH